VPAAISVGNAGSFIVGDGDARDLESLIALLDAAVVWLVDRGAGGQWGSVPFSASPAMVVYLRRIAEAGELRVARDATGRVVGGYVLGGPPGYAPAVARVERYVEAMVSDRTLAGRGIGAALVRDAIERSRAAGASLVRADCWAGAERLIRWYESQGFERGDVVLVGDWPAQLLRMSV
jgi:GNAT superfamily N-acetyltransferase